MAHTRSILPWWVTWGMTLVHVASAALACSLCGWIATQFIVVPLKAKKDSPWPERARLANAGRGGLTLGAILWPAGAAAIAFFQAGELAALRGRSLALVVLVVGYAATLAPRRFGEQRILQTPIPWSQWLREDLGMWLVRLAPFIVILLASLLVSDRFDLRTIVVLAIAVACMAALHRGVGLQLARVLGIACPASERIRRVVEFAAQRTGHRPRGVFELAFPWGNAFAWPLSDIMAFTDRAVKHLTDEELTAIAMHELAHLSEPRRVAWARSLPGMALLALALVRPLMSVSDSGAGTAFVLLGVWCGVTSALLVARRLARRMEERADESAHAHETDPGIYAQALEHIYRINVMPVVTSLKKAMHPHLYDRMLAAGLKPAYERPLPPSRFAPLAAVLVPAFAAVVPIQIGHSMIHGAAAPLDAQMGDEPALLRSIALAGGDGQTLQQLAEVRWKSGREQDAVVLLRACAQIDPLYWSCPMREAVLLASQGRCEEAREAADDAESIVEAGAAHGARSAAIDEMVRAIQRCAPAGSQ